MQSGSEDADMNMEQGMTQGISRDVAVQWNDFLGELLDSAWEQGQEVLALTLNQQWQEIEDDLLKQGFYEAAEIVRLKRLHKEAEITLRAMECDDAPPGSSPNFKK